MPVRANKIASALADSFLAGKWLAEGCRSRASQMLGRDWKWLAPLVDRTFACFGSLSRPRRNPLFQFIKRDKGFLRAHKRNSLDVRDYTLLRSKFVAQGISETWNVPSIDTVGELASWMGVTPGKLRWLATDIGAVHRTLPNVSTLPSHYAHTVLSKRFGKVRLIESPKPHLKRIQRIVLDKILSGIPIHDAAHGFCRNRSIVTAAQNHANKNVVVKLDLEDFFPSISRSKVNAIFFMAGYSEQVATALAQLCTSSAHADCWGQYLSDLSTDERLRIQDRYRSPHVPQGAPTSPYLANLACFRMDCRLAGLAKSAGANYTRYADDLVFSGDSKFQRVAKRFCDHVAATALEEGFSVNFRKTRIMPRSSQQKITGLVVNQKLNKARKEYDELKATLFNCIRWGPAGQNRHGIAEFRLHLIGRIGFVRSFNHSRGQKLQKLFDQIVW